MARSWKLFYINSFIFLKKSNTDIFARNTVISSDMLRNKVKIYNGRHFISFFIKNKMIGHKFGEFSITKILGSSVLYDKMAKKKMAKKNK